MVSLTILFLLGFGCLLEFRTALRRQPMTDLGVFVCSAGAIRDGQNPYLIADWHGWHYVYPPALAILMRPLAHPVPVPPTPPAPGTPRTAANTPWGYAIDAPGVHYGLNQDNIRFFWLVAVWYVISVGLTFLSAHTLACALEQRRWKDPPPAALELRRRWWALRTLPLLFCITSVGTDLSRGQVDLLMLAAISLALYFASRGAGLASGLFLSVPASIKMFPVLLLWYPVWRRQWRVIFGAAAGLVFFLLVIPMVALGPQRAAESYKTLIDVLVKPGLGAGNDTSRAQELTNMGATDNQSLLATIHRWSFRPDKRPLKATRLERFTSYAVGGSLLLGWSLVSGWRRKDSPRHFILLFGTLIGITLILSPVAHNYYFLLLMPLMVGLVDESLAAQERGARDWPIDISLIGFMVIDILARLPKIGNVLRELGLPFLSVVGLICLAAIIVSRQRHPAESSDPSPCSTSCLEI